MDKIDIYKVERPYDLLLQLRGKKVLIVLINKEEVSGTLVCFDMHTNIVICDGDLIPKFVRGDNILSIS